MDEKNNSMFLALGTTFCLASGLIFAILSLFIYPFIFGEIGILMGVFATKSGSRFGIYLIIMNLISMGIGIMYGK